MSRFCAGNNTHEASSWQGRRCTGRSDESGLRCRDLLVPAPLAIGEHEAWLPLPGYEGRYEASDLGRVRSVIKSGKTLVLRPSPDSCGYPTVSLYKDGTSRRMSVHLAVQLAFRGPRPDGMVTRHLDGNPANNRLENLSYGTHLENTRDKIAHGTHAFGENNPSAILTEDQVKEIRRLRGVVSQRALARQFGVSRSAVQDVQMGRRWSWLGGLGVLAAALLTGCASHDLAFACGFVTGCAVGGAAVSMLFAGWWRS